MCYFRLPSSSYFTSSIISDDHRVSSTFDEEGRLSSGMSATKKSSHDANYYALRTYILKSWVVREKENFQKWVIEWNFLLLEITISCMPTNQTLSSTIIIKMSDVISILKINFNWLSRMFDHTNLKIFDCQTWLLFALWPWWSCHGQNGVNL